MRRIEGARRQGLHAAARRLRSQLIRQAEHLQDQVIYLVAELRKQAAPQNLPAVSEFYRDILALEHEFEEVGVDCGHHEVFVTTEPVELEGIYLGPFQIRLNWNALGAWPAYSIVALEPNPAASNEEVTHPHVQDGVLCEGEGRSAIRGALSQGRLYDFFLLIWQIRPAAVGHLPLADSCSCSITSEVLTPSLWAIVRSETPSCRRASRSRCTGLGAEGPTAAGIVPDWKATVPAFIARAPVTGVEVVTRSPRATDAIGVPRTRDRRGTSRNSPAHSSLGHSTTIALRTIDLKALPLLLQSDTAEPCKSAHSRRDAFPNGRAQRRCTAELSSRFGPRSFVICSVARFVS